MTRVPVILQSAAVRRVLSLLLLGALGACALILAPVRLSAHGGGTPQLTGAEAGPYRLYAWTEPEPWRAGDVHIDIAVAIPAPSAAGEAGEVPVTEADVQIRLHNAISDERLNLNATPLEFLNSFYYESSFELPSAGNWQVEILVRGAEGEGRAAFHIEAEAARQLNWLLIGGGAGILVVAGALGVLWSRNDTTPSPRASERRTQQQTGTQA